MLFCSFSRLNLLAVLAVLGVVLIGSPEAIIAAEAPAAHPTEEVTAAVPASDAAPNPGALAPDEGWEILPQPRNTNPESAAPANPRQVPESAPADNETLRSIVTRRNLALPLKDANIVISKGERRLELYSGKTLIKTYQVALGDNPSGHKQRQGDSRTPEGHFYICTRNAKDSAFHIFLGLSYPGVPDARRAVNSRQITWREYQLINQRLASRGRPLWETKLGGWVGIHGGSDAAFAKKMRNQRGKNDWTAGCIALTNQEIAEIHAATVLGTPVEIRP